MKTKPIVATLQCASLAFFLTFPSVAQQTTTDVGTLDKEAAAHLFPVEAALLPLCGA